jgi:hypothetical protein
MKPLNCSRPAKQRRALLESNSPRDNWIEGDEIKNVSAFGEAQTSPNEKRDLFISSRACLKKLISNRPEFSQWTKELKTVTKNYVSWYPFFRSKRSSMFNRPDGFRTPVEALSDGSNLKNRQSL